jgi:spermidine synthase
MDLWYTEKVDGSVGITMKIKSHLFHRQTSCQTIDIFDTAFYGKLMVIDGAVMLTEADEFVYHESITHIPLGWIRHPKRVLIIGGGDGGTAREVLRYPSLEEVVLVEIDREVINASKKFFPNLSSSFNDKRLNLLIQDGARFVKDSKVPFDVIIVDSTDPVGPGKVLFSEEFYRNCSAILREGGILTAQTESPFDRTNRSVIRDIYKSLRNVFQHTHMYLASIPTYPFGLWSFAFASNSINPVKTPPIAEYVPQELKYYNYEYARHAFALPNFVREIINEGERSNRP